MHSLMVSIIITESFIYYYLGSIEMRKHISPFGKVEFKLLSLNGSENNKISHFIF